MKKTLLFIGFIILSFTAMLSAQNSSKFTGSLLWKVSGKGLDKPSYILGTHHLADVSFVDSISGLRAAMDEVEQVAGELLMSDTQTLSAKIQESAMMPAGQSYKELLDEVDYNKLDAGLKSLVGAGIDQLGAMKPGMISTLTSLMMYVKMQPGFNPQKHVAIDQYVQTYAIEKEKTVLGLETVEDQIYALFDATPLKEQAEILACSMSNLDFGEKVLLKMNELYFKGDLSGLYALAMDNKEDPCPMSEKAEYAINKQRNDRWMEKLPQILKDKSTLVAVGALHLGGEEGILSQLSKLGYKVEKVR